MTGAFSIKQKKPERLSIKKVLKTRGRKPNTSGQWVPTSEDRDAIECMLIAGLTQERIAAVMKVRTDTLRLHCSEQITNGGQGSHNAVISALYRNAIGGNVAAQIFYLKTRCRWRETDPVDPAKVFKLFSVMAAEPAKALAQVDPPSDIEVKTVLSGLDDDF